MTILWEEEKAADATSRGAVYHLHDRDLRSHRSHMIIKLWCIAYQKFRLERRGRSIHIVAYCTHVAIGVGNAKLWRFSGNFEEYTHIDWSDLQLSK